MASAISELDRSKIWLAWPQGCNNQRGGEEAYRILHKCGRIRESIVSNRFSNKNSPYINFGS